MHPKVERGWGGFVKNGPSQLYKVVYGVTLHYKLITLRYILFGIPYRGEEEKSRLYRAPYDTNITEEYIHRSKQQVKPKRKNGKQENTGQNKQQPGRIYQPKPVHEDQEYRQCEHQVK